MRGPYGTSSSERSNVRNGYWQRDSDTRVGTLDVAIPSCARAGTSRTVRMSAWFDRVASDPFYD